MQGSTCSEADIASLNLEHLKIYTCSNIVLFLLNSTVVKGMILFIRLKFRCSKTESLQSPIIIMPTLSWLLKRK